MSRLNDLIRRVAATNEALAADLQREVDALANRRSFGLNFERHVPEAVELPGRPVRRGDKVRRLPERGQTPKSEDERLFRVTKKYTDAGGTWANIEALDDPDDACCVKVQDLVVVAEFRDPIYPGLVSTGKVERGGDKPFHTVINAENFHALQTLLYTHRGKVDCIYIDPPYNTGARDWKYNNDYVEREDIYRHSKWLAFMERRLLLAKELLNPDDSALVVTIDEKEVHRLRMLIEQTLPDARVQMITSVISQNGTSRDGEFSRVEEYLLVARVGDNRIARTADNMLSVEGKGTVSRVWFNFMRTSTAREKLEGQFYPILIDPLNGLILELGSPVGRGNPVPEIQETPTRIAVWPIRDDGKAATWGAVPETAAELLRGGFLRVGKLDERTGRWSIQYVREGDRKRIDSGQIAITGHREDGSVKLEHIDLDQRENFPKTVWNRTSHDATAHGTRLNKILIPGREFPYPKSLYAVEDTLRFFTKSKPNAVVLDFFAGSGTTAHAVMRLNKQDGGRRQAVSVTNNEVSAVEQKSLREDGLRPGDPDWEEHGICDHITKPRLRAAITGRNPTGDPIKGDYKFTDEFPMSDGFEENVEFFTLTYESPLRVASNRDFERIAPLLWMRAGSVGRRIEDVTKGWDVADSYGVIADLDQTDAFLEAIVGSEGVNVAFIVTNDDRLFESLVRELPEYVEPVRLYESYLRNFELESGRSTR